MNDKILITTGDVNGIGPEVTIKALRALGRHDDIVLVSNRRVLEFYGGGDLACDVIEVPFEGQILPGKITAESGDFSFRALELACKLRPKAIVTAPIAKEAIQLAGHDFTGHTEILEHYLAHNGQKAEMLFAAGDFRVLLLTRHCALKDIVITQNLVVEKILRLVEFLPLRAPKLALCGLNPHAGENGLLGAEEKDIIIPAVEKLRALGVDITLPMPSDTLFIGAAEAYRSESKAPFDCYIAMYHDQGLIPMKVIAGKKAVNVTIGLDILRTSPCHGTAFDIAGRGVANPQSMIEAVSFALGGRQ